MASRENNNQQEEQQLRPVHHPTSRLTRQLISSSPRTPPPHHSTSNNQQLLAPGTDNATRRLAEVIRNYDRLFALEESSARQTSSIANDDCAESDHRAARLQAQAKKPQEHAQAKLVHPQAQAKKRKAMRNDAEPQQQAQTKKRRAMPSHAEDQQQAQAKKRPRGEDEDAGLRQQTPRCVQLEDLLSGAKLVCTRCNQTIHVRWYQGAPAFARCASDECYYWIDKRCGEDLVD
eukprot:scaffold3855_cov131-Pinguiococcus_pyrenoidosus.AAC.2